MNDVTAGIAILLLSSHVVGAAFSYVWGMHVGSTIVEREDKWLADIAHHTIDHPDHMHRRLHWQTEDRTGIQYLCMDGCGEITYLDTSEILAPDTEE